MIFYSCIKSLQQRKVLKIHPLTVTEPLPPREWYLVSIVPYIIKYSWNTNYNNNKTCNRSFHESWLIVVYCHLKNLLLLSFKPVDRLSYLGFALWPLFGHSRQEHHQQPLMVKFIKTPTDTADNETIVVLIPIIMKQSYFYKLRHQKLWTPVICPHVY